MNIAFQDFAPSEEDYSSSAPASPQDGATLHFVLKLALLVLFVPQELSFFIGDLRLTFERLLFLLITPLVFVRLARKVSTGHYRFVASDLFVPLTAFWMFIGPTVTEGLGDALRHSGPVVLEYLISYLATRTLLSGHRSSLIFVTWLCVVIAAVVADALLDPITGRYITQELCGQITGYTAVGYNSDNFRFGLLRATGPVEHPILFGFVSAIGLLLAATLKIRWRKLCIAACALGVVMSFSSAPQQSVLLGFCLLLYGRVFAGLRSKWLLIGVALASALAILFISTPTPFGHIFNLTAINPETAYFRLYVWNMIGPVVLQNPYFGVPDGSYGYEGSVDSLWLVLAMVYGVPCGILTAMSMIGCCSRPTGVSRAGLSEEETKLGTTLGIIIFMTIYMGFTVHFWGEVWILIGLLMGVRAHLGELGATSNVVLRYHPIDWAT